MKVRERRHLDDSGVTVVELIVYVVVAAILLGVMASLFATGLKAEASTRDRDTATGQAQVVSNSIQTSIRNSSDFDVTGSLLRARVATGTSGWECRAWVLSGGSILYKTSSTAIAAGSYTGWKALAAGVTGSFTGGVPFAKTGSRLDLKLTVTKGSATVPITGGVTAQAKSEGTATSCW